MVIVLNVSSTQIAYFYLEISGVEGGKDMTVDLPSSSDLCRLRWRPSDQGYSSVARSPKKSNVELGSILIGWVKTIREDLAL